MIIYIYALWTKYSWISKFLNYTPKKQKHRNLGKIQSRPITTLAAQRMDAARLNGLFPFGCDVSKQKRRGKASYDYRIL